MKRRRVSSGKSLQERIAFYSLPDLATGCVEWQAAKNDLGYGRLWDGKRLQYAHRLAWQSVHGDIPAGMCVCHRCDNPGCVAIDHLFLGTIADNLRDRDEKGRHRNGAEKRRGQPSPLRGEKHPKSRLTAIQALEIYKEVGSSDGRSRAEIARAYGVSWSLINGIAKGKNWKHVGSAS